MVNYRQATVSDARQLAEMNWNLIRDEGHRNAMGPAELEARMTQWLEDEYQAVLFEEGDQSVGYALFRRDPEYVYLRQFFIRREYRRRGFGRAAMAWLAQHIWSGERVRLDVLVGNAAAISFWRSIGFRDYCLTLERDVVFSEEPASRPLT
jgi:ribosomal protein S18 acetylase RimI-like enzyme